MTPAGIWETKLQIEAKLLFRIQEPLHGDATLATEAATKQSFISPSASLVTLVYQQPVDVMCARERQLEQTRSTRWKDVMIQSFCASPLFARNCDCTEHHAAL